MEKNIKKYIKLYNEASEKCHEKWGYCFPPRDWNEFEAWDKKTYQKFFENETWETEVIKAKCYINILARNFNEFGFFASFQSSSYENLNNVLYQISRQKLLDSAMTASGYSTFMLDIPLAFACNDFETVEHFFPKEMPVTKGYYTEQDSLCKALYYNDKKLQDNALILAKKYLGCKRTNWQKYIILYFLALVNREVEQASACLQELCTAYQKQGDIAPLDKCFAAEIHGLYHFARLIDEDFFKKITRPKHDCFFEEFETWQEENHYPKGKIFYTYPSEMDYLNKIFASELPTVALLEVKYGNKTAIYQDEEKFAADLAENIKKIL